MSLFKNHVHYNVALDHHVLEVQRDSQGLSPNHELATTSGEWGIYGLVNLDAPPCKMDHAPPCLHDLLIWIRRKSFFEQLAQVGEKAKPKQKDVSPVADMLANGPADAHEALSGDLAHEMKPKV